MHLPAQFRLASLTITALTAITGTHAASAATLFNQQEVDQNRFVLVASPYDKGAAHQLLIIEQISNKRPCWREVGSSPTTIDPLLTQFDFTKICGRSTDSNGYSIRAAGEDVGLRYNLRVVRRDGDLLLVGTPIMDRKAPELVIGRANGVTSGFAKFNLEPGWRLTRRVYNSKPIGHVYLTNDQSLTDLIAAANANKPELEAPIIQPALPPIAVPKPPQAPIATPSVGQPLPPPPVNVQPLPSIATPTPATPIATPSVGQPLPPPPVNVQPLPPIATPRPSPAVATPAIIQPLPAPVQPVTPTLTPPLTTPPASVIPTPTPDVSPAPNPAAPAELGTGTGDFVVPTVSGP